MYNIRDEMSAKNKHMELDKYFDLINSDKTIAESRESVRKFIPNTLYKYCSFPENDKELKQRLCQLKHEQIWFSAKRTLNDPFEFLNATLQNCTLEMKRYYENTMLEKGIFRLTNCNQNELMWSHYADAYRGYCIDFRVVSKIHLFPVFYTDEVLDLSDEYKFFYDNRLDFKNIPSSSNCASYYRNLYKLKLLYRVKRNCWRYEQEYRILGNESIRGKVGKIYKASNYGLEIANIICGPYCSMKHIEQLKSCVQYINRERIRDLQREDENLKPFAAIKELKRNRRYVYLKQFVLDPNLELIERDISSDMNCNLISKNIRLSQRKKKRV